MVYAGTIQPYLRSKVSILNAELWEYLSLNEKVTSGTPFSLEMMSKRPVHRSPSRKILALSMQFVIVESSKLQVSIPKDQDQDLGNPTISRYLMPNPKKQQHQRRASAKSKARDGREPNSSSRDFMPVFIRLALFNQLFFMRRDPFREDHFVIVCFK
jgi:hypothetical protein